MLSEDLPAPHYRLHKNARCLKNATDLFQEIKNVKVASKILISGKSQTAHLFGKERLCKWGRSPRAYEFE